MAPATKEFGDGMFRSQDMQYVHITMTNESAHNTVRELGLFGKLHIVDLSAGKEIPSKQHFAYKKRVADCLYWEKRLSNLEEEINRQNIPLPLRDDELRRDNGRVGDAIDTVQQYLDPIEREYTLGVNVLREARAQRAALVERRYVLRSCQDISLCSLILFHQPKNVISL